MPQFRLHVKLITSFTECKYLPQSFIFHLKKIIKQIMKKNRIEIFIWIMIIRYIFQYKYENFITISVFKRKNIITDYDIIRLWINNESVLNLKYCRYSFYVYYVVTVKILYKASRDEIHTSISSNVKIAKGTKWI